MIKKHTSSYTSYEVIVQQDENGDLLIPIPPMLLKALDWKDGDDLEIEMDSNGKYIIKKANK